MIHSFSIAASSSIHQQRNNFPATPKHKLIQDNNSINPSTCLNTSATAGTPRTTPKVEPTSQSKPTNSKPQSEHHDSTKPEPTHCTWGCSQLLVEPKRISGHRQPLHSFELQPQSKPTTLNRSLQSNTRAAAPQLRSSSTIRQLNAQATTPSAAIEIDPKHSKLTLLCVTSMDPHNHNRK
ncbi:hypothetical protein Droror1_Dr00004810 [Drosera rotundifolia]